MMCNRVWQVLAISAGLMWVGATFGAEFMPLPQLPGATLAGDAFGVSADGSTIVGTSHNGVNYQAVRWNLAGGIERLGAGDSSFARDASTNGSVIVGYQNVPGGQRALRWTSATGAVDIGDLPGGNVGAQAFGLSADGSVVVGASSSANGGEGFLWTASEGMIGVGDLPGGIYAGVAYATSSDGYSVSGNGIEAFRWTPVTGIVGLGDLPGGGFFSEAYDVSADGSVVVGRSIANSGLFPSRAFRWSADEGMVALPDVPGVGPTAIAQGISGDGSVIVGAATEGDSATAFAWDRFHGSRKIADLLVAQGVDLQGFELGKANAASFDGLTIVGSGLPAGSRTFQPWVARLDPGTFVPEPSSVALASIGAMVVLVFAPVGFL